MRTLTVLLSSTLGTLACAGFVASGMKQENRQERQRERLVLKIQDLNLSDEQESKITQIRDEFRPKVESAGKELSALVKEEVEKIHALLTPEQKEKLQALKEERKERREEHLSHKLAHLEEMELTEAEIAKIEEIRKESGPKIEKATEALHGILTDEQRKTREEGLKAGKPRREILASLNLTEDQKKIMMGACKDISAAVREELEKIRDVLNEAQRARLQELRDERKEHVRDRIAHRAATLQELNLTDEQRNKIQDIRKEFRPKIHEAGNKLRATVREEVEAIMNVLKG